MIDTTKNPKGRFTLQISSFGYIPYKNLLNQILTNTQHAPPETHSFLLSPEKVALMNIQSSSGGIVR